jgi:hypothetical protein
MVGLARGGHLAITIRNLRVSLQQPLHSRLGWRKNIFESLTMVTLLTYLLLPFFSTVVMKDHLFSYDKLCMKKIS